MNYRTLNIVGSSVSLAVIAVVIGYAVLHEHDVGVDRKAPGPVAPAAGIRRDPPIATPATVAGAHPSPLQAYATAKTGDWIAYRVRNAGSLGEFTSVVVSTVTGETPTTVTRTFHGRIDQTGEERSGRDETFPRGGLTIERLTGRDIGEWAISDVTIADEPHAIGGRSFPCKKISYASADPLFPTKRTRTELWISTEVPVGGLVAERETQELDTMRFELGKELIGFGDANGVTWGQRPPGL